MAAVESTLRLNDQVSRPLRDVSKALTTVINDLKKTGTISDNTFNSARADINRANDSLKKLNETEKKTAEEAKKAGRVGKQGMQDIGTSAKKSTSMVGRLKGGIGGMIGKIKGMVGAAAAVYGVKKAFDFLKSSVDAANKKVEEQTKLREVMRAMQGATDKDVAGVEAVMAQESQTGVVGAGAQRSGAQQISTYLHETDSVKTLIPALNDLAVQMHGTEVSGEQMVNIANMAGKVFSGQVGALRRAGISFDEAQEKVMKYGTESEKAAMLAKVIGQNVGNMNQEMAKTPSGKMKQVKNQLAGMKTTIGEALLPALSPMADAIVEIMPVIRVLALVLGKVLGAAFMYIATCAKMFVGVWKTLFEVISRTKTFKLIVKDAKDLWNTIKAVGIWIKNTLVNAFKTSKARGDFRNLTKVARIMGKVIGTAIRAAIKILKVLVIVAGVVVRGVIAKWRTMARVFNTVAGKVIGICRKIRSAFQRVGSGIKNAFSGIGGRIKGALNPGIDAINGFITRANNLASKIPGVSLSIPTIPHLAKGTRNATGGPTLVGERGPEIVNLRKGDTVTTNRDSRKALSGKTAIISKIADTIVVRENSDIDAIASAIVSRLEQAEYGVVPA